MRKQLNLRLSITSKTKLDNFIHSCPEIIYRHNVIDLLIEKHLHEMPYNEVINYKNNKKVDKTTKVSSTNVNAKKEVTYKTNTNDNNFNPEDFTMI